MINPDSRISDIMTIKKTLMASTLFEGFWDRWIAHGVNGQVAKEARRKSVTLHQWIRHWDRYAVRFAEHAEIYQGLGMLQEAEFYYRLSGLHYYLIQWIFPDASKERQDWFIRCKGSFRMADAIAPHEVKETAIAIDGNESFGRICIPVNPKGCVIIVNPIDSSKEELISYELDFIQEGFITVSFDGPGQGETFLSSGWKASRANWSLFIDRVIEFTASQFHNVPIHLFGTSSGAAWSIYGSRNARISKAVSVSPACENGIRMPDYFTERMNGIVEEPGAVPLPELNNLEQCGPVLLFHGKKDAMVRDEDIQALHDALPQGKRLVTYEDEGHCCNYKLAGIRKLSCQWLLTGEDR